MSGAGVLSLCGLGEHSSFLSSELSPFTLHVCLTWNSNQQKPFNKTSHTWGQTRLIRMFKHTATHRQSFIVPDWMHFQINSHRLRRREVLVGHLDQSFCHRQLLFCQYHLPGLYGQSLDWVHGQSLEGGWGILGEPRKNQRWRGRRRLVLRLRE